MVEMQSKIVKELEEAIVKTENDKREDEIAVAKYGQEVALLGDRVIFTGEDETNLRDLRFKIAEQEKSFQLASERNSINTKIGELEADGERMRLQICDLEEALKLNGVFIELDKLASERLTENYNEIKHTDFLLGEIKSLKKETAELEAEKSDIIKTNHNKKETLSGLELLRDAMGANGIKAIVIDYLIPQLESKINVILSQLSDFRVKLETQQGGIGEDVVLEGLFINIINDQGEELEFANYSGGERLKIIVAISEALADIQRVNFRVMDELFLGLDEESTEKFAEVMGVMGQRFGQLICISHLRNIKDLFYDKLSVVKTNGVSTVVQNSRS
jgi:DNA repair exonuclease SbcCD ATPase subunit